MDKNEQLKFDEAIKKTRSDLYIKILLMMAELSIGRHPNRKEINRHIDESLGGLRTLLFEGEEAYDIYRKPSLRRDFDDSIETATEAARMEDERLTQLLNKKNDYIRKE
jgi:ribosome-binding protein aMBF1 (putative translation factor)